MELRKYAIGFAEESTFGAGEGKGAADEVELTLIPVSDPGFKGDIAQIDRNTIANSFLKLPSMNGSRSITGAVNTEVIPKSAGGSPTPEPLCSVLWENLIGKTGTDFTGFTAGTTQAGTLATSLVLDVGEGAEYAVDDIVYVEVTTGKFEAAAVTGVTSDTLAIEPALSAAPAIGKAVHKAYTLKPGGTADYTKSLWAMEYFGTDAGGTGHSRKMWGLKVSGMDFSVAVGELVRPKFDLMGSDWDISPADMLIADAAIASIDADPVVGLRGRCMVNAASYDMLSAGLTIKNSLENMTAITSTGITGIRMTERETTGKFSVYFEQDSFLNAFADSTRMKVFVQCGRSRFGMFGFYVKKAKLTGADISNDKLRKNEVPFSAEESSPGANDEVILFFG